MQILLELLLEKRKPVHAEEHMKSSFKAMKLNKSSSGYLPSLILEQLQGLHKRADTSIAMSNYDFVKRKNTSS